MRLYILKEKEVIREEGVRDEVIREEGVRDEAIR